MGLFSSIASIAAPVLGAVVSGNKSNSAAKQANEFTREQLQNQHQWETADLEKAGLNRILSANSGAGTGGSAMAQTPDYAKASSDAIDKALQSSQIDQMKSQTELNRANAATAKTQQSLNASAAQKINAETTVIGRNEPTGKFIKQAGDNALGILNKVPPANTWLKNLGSSAKNAYMKFTQPAADLGAFIQGKASKIPPISEKDLWKTLPKGKW